MPKLLIDSIEAAIREGKCAGVALAELNGRVVSPGEGELRCREVDPDHHGATLGGRSRGIARAGGDVHDPRPAPDPGRIEECPDGLRRNG